MQLLTLALGCAFAALAAGDEMAPAMAPAGTMPKSDLTFFVTADNSTFKTKGSTTMLKLWHTAETVPYVSAGHQVNLLTTGKFANSSLGSPLLAADGHWLDTPQAILYGTGPSGNLSSILLSLDGAAYDASSRTLKFNVTVVAPQQEDVKLLGGPIEAAVKDSTNGVGPNLATAANTGEAWTGATLVIESTRTSLHQVADTKYWGGWNRGWYWG